MKKSGIGVDVRGGYSSPVTARFDENRGRLFLVDYSKSCAMSSVCELLARRDFSSFLCVVGNIETARDFERVLTPVLGNVCIIDSYETFMNIIGPGDSNQKSFLKRSQNLISQCQNLIMVASDRDGNSIFNHKLCPSSEKDGKYSNGMSASYCVSDMLADCGYGFVLVDDVYRYFELVEATSDDISAYSPEKYDRVTFLGNSYFSDEKHSYGRLRKLVAGADKCVVMSNIVAKYEAVNLYAVLDMVYSGFSTVKLRRLINENGSHYKELCEKFCIDVSFCRDDDSIIAGCLQQTKGKGGYAPYDINSMGRYLSLGLEYMSEEEEFLRVYDSIDRIYFGGRRCPAGDAIYSIENESERMIPCFCDIFFGNVIKHKLEVGLSVSKLNAMSGEEIKHLFAVFMEYGVYHYVYTDMGRVKCLRFRRDNSGFEFFLRNEPSEAVEDTYSYSVIADGDDLFYKCVELSRLFGGRDNELFAPAPVVVVTSAEPVSVCETVSKLIPGAFVTCDVNALTDANVGRNLIVVLGLEQARSTPLRLNVSSAVLFDVFFELTETKLLINKLLCEGAQSVYLTATYGNIVGALLDKWQPMLLCNEPIIAVDNSGMSLKDGEFNEYRHVLNCLNEAYSTLVKVVSSPDDINVDRAIEKLNKIISDFTLNVSIPVETIKMDMEYLKGGAVYYDGVFRNTASVGDGGDRTLVKTKSYICLTKSKKATEMSDEQQYVYSMFNVCAKMLRHECDLTKNNCADCGYYERFMCNDFEALKTHVYSFFDYTLRYVKQLELRRLYDSTTVIVHDLDYSEDGNGYMSSGEIAQWAESARRGLEAIDIEKDMFTAFFNANYAHTAAIRTAVYAVYSRLLRKYYTVIKNIFDQATEKAQVSYRIAGESVNGANNG